MTDSTTTTTQRVRFEEATPTYEIVAYFDTQLSSLLAGTGLPIFLGYDDLDYIQFGYVTLPSGHTVVVGQYENAPEIGVDLHIDLNPKHHPTSSPDYIPALVVETLRYLDIPRETATWFHPDSAAEIDRLYSTTTQIEPIFRNGSAAIPPNQDAEPIECFYYALDIYTREKSPEYWAMLQHNLGLAYYHRTQGERWRNLIDSIACFNKSLEVFHRHEYPQKWQINQEDLQQSKDAWAVEKPKLIEDIRDRGGENRDFSLADLSGGHLSNADLSNANLSGANLSNALLICAIASGVNLSGANLSNANSNNADLSGANLSNANLSDVYLSGAKLINANLSGANLNGADLGVADLSGANLSGANLNGADLSIADLSGVDLSGFNLSGFNLSRTDLISANLSHANLSGADLSDADLSRANLRDANIKKTQFGNNQSIPKLQRRNLILRGAIFSNRWGDPHDR
jgi:uncharacterized protein YjbI with pentapeptide repeats